MNWSDKKVLVTGAGGFIGSHLAEHLARLGARTRAMVRYNAHGSWGWLDHSPMRGEIEVALGDICDRDSVKSAMSGVDMVFHLAALIAIPYSYAAPHSYVRTNIEGALNVLMVAHDLGVEKVVHTSSSEVYGTAIQVPIDENHPLKGQSPYAASKIGADKMAEAFHLSFGVPVATVRPFNTFGPRQSLRAVIPSIIGQCLKGATSIRLGAVTPTRDMNFVGNTVEGYIAAAESEQAVGRSINFGSGIEISIGDLARMIGELIGQPLEIKHDDHLFRPEKSEVNRLVADSSLARELTGWKPRTDLRTGLSETIDWMRDNLDKYPAESHH